MEKDDLLKDEFLRDLIRKTPMEEPSDDFVNKVMAGIQPGLETFPVKKSFFYYLKISWPYVLIGFAVVVFFLTSDLPFSGYFSTTLVPSFKSLFTGFSHFMVNSKVTTIGLMVIGGGGLLFFFDRILQKSRDFAHHTMN
ncbi:MAG: hypothetical protein Q8867_08510 [Bacteroidota bacterium]|nr:hypothetical protein [Bacteroidota bacterium]